MHIAKLCVILALSAISAHAVMPSVSSSEIDLTDQVTLTLPIDIPPDYRFDEEALAKRLVDYGEVPLETFKIVSREMHKANGKIILSYILEPTQPGEHYLTFRYITLTGQDKPDITLLSEPVKIVVKAPESAIPLQAAGVLPLTHKPILEIDHINQQVMARQQSKQPDLNRRRFIDRNFPWHYLILYPLGITLILVSAWGFHFIRKRWKKPLPTPTPSEEASRELEALPISNDFNSYYVSLINTLRKYIEKEYQLPLTEMTTEEFMAHIAKEAPFDTETRQALINLLSQADKIKFAKEPATEESSQQALRYAQQFISHR